MYRLAWRELLWCACFLMTPRWEVSVAILETFSEIKQHTQKSVFATHSEKHLHLARVLVSARVSRIRKKAQRGGRADKACNRKMEN